MLKCTKCNTDKPRNEFYACGASKGRNGYTYWCKQCYANNYKENRERQLLSNRRASIKRRYGLTVEEYDALVAKGCSICGETEKRVVMDHCHASNAVRAPLCDQCNQGIGNFRDDVALLAAAIRYLESHAAA